MKPANVGITKCFSYNEEEVLKAVKESCSVCNFPDVLGKKVLVKPNILSDAKPEDCITTHPSVVQAVIKVLKEKGAAEIYCGDSPGLHNSSFCGKNCGIYEICEKENAIWTDFTQNPDTVRIDGTKHSLTLARIVHEVDVIISVCKFKTHTLMYATGAVKNLFGLVPGLHKSSCHLSNPSKESFAKLIAGIHETVKPSFCVMDAIIGMEGPGPANGTPKPINCIIASDNCFACDIAELTMMGYKENEIPIINEARRRHLIPSINYPLLNAEDLVIENFKRIQITKKPKMIRTLVFPYFTRGIQKRRQKGEVPPAFNHEKCIRCKRCINICPAHALQLSSENKVSIDTSKCIRCYCCHEMCPADAIAINKL